MKAKKCLQINIAPCGLVCSRCDAYRATQKNDEGKLEQVAAEWRKLNHCDEIKAEYLHCDGCMAKSNRKSAFCGMCKIRLCALEKEVAVCSECTEYPCAKLTEFLANQPPEQIAAMRKMLDGIVEVEKTTHHIF